MIILNPGAARALDRLDAPVRSRITQALHDYALSGRGQVRQMAGTATRRLRVGDYRIIFDETEDSLTVLALGHRREIYR